MEFVTVSMPVCRRYPPRPYRSDYGNMGSVSGLKFADTRTDMWCGEWKEGEDE
jgi:hypothetical protein